MNRFEFNIIFYETFSIFKHIILNNEITSEKKKLITL